MSHSPIADALLRVGESEPHRRALAVIRVRRRYEVYALEVVERVGRQRDRIVGRVERGFQRNVIGRLGTSSVKAHDLRCHDNATPGRRLLSKVQIRTIIFSRAIIRRSKQRPSRKPERSPLVPSGDWSRR